MRSTAAYIWSSWGASARAVLEYRLAFALQAGLMLVNNLMFLAFWGVFFARFRTIGGWSFQDVALCYGLTATGFGLAAVLLGGSMNLSSAIGSGELEDWLLRPQPVLVQALTSRMRLSGFGDIATGVVLATMAGHLTPRRLALAAALSVLSMIVFAAFWTLCNLPAFWAGTSEDIAIQGMNLLVTFSVHPPTLFSGAVRVALHVLVPAALVSWIPASLVSDWSWLRAGGLIAGTALLCAVVLLVWRAGLKRHESGSSFVAGD